MPNTTDKPKFLAVDFYCGAGGTTRGLLDAGGYVIAGIDKDEDCRNTYQRNNRNTTLNCSEPEFLALDMFPNSPDYPHGQQQEVRDKLNELIPEYRGKAPGVPLLFAICAPCQSFTKFVQRNMSDKRIEDRKRAQNLLAQTVGFIETFQPEMVISENVASIVSGQYKHIWSDFQEDLRKLGHAVACCSTSLAKPTLTCAANCVHSTVRWVFSSVLVPSRRDRHLGNPSNPRLSPPNQPQQSVMLGLV